MGDDQFPKLGDTARDRALALSKGALSSIPFAGGFISELVGTLVPAQRLSRIESYLEALRAQLVGMQEDQARLIAASPEHIDLFEEGAFRAARAINAERISKFAVIVAIGMTGGTSEAISQKRLLTIFSELDEQDIIILFSYVMRNRADAGDFYQTHRDLIGLEKYPATVFSSREEREASALRFSIDQKLRRYGLLEIEERPSSALERTLKNERVSQLGLLILRTAGLVANETIR